jgi:hypothetical protein
MERLAVYFIEGEKLCTKVFHGEPQKGDCFLCPFVDPGGGTQHHLVVVVSRRWTEEGELELIVDFPE